MSVLPKEGEPLLLFQGSTFDETWVFTDEDGVPLWTDPTDWSGDLVVRKDFDGAALLALSKIAAIGTPPDTDGLVFAADGSVRIYVTDETMAELSHLGFTEARDEEGVVGYVGVWDFESENPDGERVREVMGPATFSRQVTHA